MIKLKYKFRYSPLKISEGMSVLISAIGIICLTVLIISIVYRMGPPTKPASLKNTTTVSIQETLKDINQNQYKSHYPFHLAYDTVYYNINPKNNHDTIQAYKMSLCGIKVSEISTWNNMFDWWGRDIGYCKYCDKLAPRTVAKKLGKRYCVRCKKYHK